MALILYKVMIAITFQEIKVIESEKIHLLNISKPNGNCKDDAFKTSNGNLTFGYIMMINCNAICAGTPKGLDFFSIREAEARAILPATRKAKDKGPSNIYVLSDPSGLIYKGNVERATNPLILDFANESENFDGVDFSCIPRHCNESDQSRLILGLVALLCTVCLSCLHNETRFLPKKN